MSWACGAIEWLRQQRLAHARLLRASGMPVAAVASAAGTDLLQH